MEKRSLLWLLLLVWGTQRRLWGCGGVSGRDGEPIMDYKSKRWKRLRERILRRDDYMCQVSKRYGRRVEANTVHHIYPADQYPEYQWCEWNLISLSQSVHNEMHVRDTDELTEKGKALQRRVQKFLEK